MKASLSHRNLTAICCVAIAVAFLASCLSSRRHHSHGPWPYLNSDAMFLRNSLDELAVEQPEAFKEFVRRRPQSIFDHGLYTAATNAMAHQLGNREDIRQYPSGMDAWGVPFWVEITFLRSATNNLGRKEQVYEIKLWTSGRNRKNDHGAKDDVLYGPFETVTEERQ